MNRRINGRKDCRISESSRVGLLTNGGQWWSAEADLFPSAFSIVVKSPTVSSTSLVSYQRRSLEVWKNCRSKVSRPDSRSIGEDDEEIEKLWTAKKFRDEYSEPIPILFLANGKRRVFSGNLKRRAVIGQRSRTRENFIPLELAKWRKGNIFLNPIEDRELCSNVWRVNPYRVLLSPWKTGKYRGLS